MEASFTLIGEMGMTGTMIRANQTQWRALTKVKLHEAFYVSILWGGSPFKVLEDAIVLEKRTP